MPKVNNEIPEKSRGIIESSHEEKVVSKKKEDEDEVLGSDNEQIMSRKRSRRKHI